MNYRVTVFKCEKTLVKKFISDAKIRLHSEKVYFDGYLPPQKRPVRISRLETYLKQLITFHSSFPNGLRIQQAVPESIDITARILFDLATPVPNKFRGLPASPFLVPAVLDALSISRYAGIVKVVHGEADAFCADAVRKYEGIIMTSDSDLLVYDLGIQGAVAFFNQVELQNRDGNQCQVIEIPLFKPRDIAKHLNVDSISRLAFELKVDPLITLREVVRRAKQPLPGQARRLSYEEFMVEYAVNVSCPQIIDSSHSRREPSISGVGFMDPRISEFVLQADSEDNSVINVYLPFLIDDPSRLSAWDVALSLRCFSYSLLTHASTFKSLQSIHEYGRRGWRIAPSEVETLTRSQTMGYAETMKNRLIAVKAHLADKPGTDVWRCFGLIILISWYLENGRRLPTIDNVSNIVYGNNAKTVTWETIQLSAQFQAVVYSIRIVKHILDHMLTRTPNSPTMQLVELCRALDDLPFLNKLLPSSSETQKGSKPSMDIGQFYKLIMSMASPNDQSGRMKDVDQEIDATKSEQILSEDGWQEVTSKRIKSKKGRSQSRRGRYNALGASAKLNTYNILAQ